MATRANSIKQKRPACPCEETWRGAKGYAVLKAKASVLAKRLTVKYS